MMNIDQYKYVSTPYLKLKKYKIYPLSDEGVTDYLGPTSHVHNYLPHQLRYI